MNDWLAAVEKSSRVSEPSVLVSVAKARGSTPREPGTKMLVTGTAIHGTIGGGNLEFKAIEIARASLAEGLAGRTALRRFPLGPNLGQCCGGVAVLLFESIEATLPGWVKVLSSRASARDSAVIVTCGDAPAHASKLIVTATACHGELASRPLTRRAEVIARNWLKRDCQGVAELRKIPLPEQPAVNVLFEPLARSNIHIVLFGAGHVGRALVQVLAPLPCTITWVDNRADQFPREVPANVTVALCEAPQRMADLAPSRSYFLIMTHSHPLDYAICERVLKREDFRYCGLIGSITKSNRFRRRLLAAGLSETALTRLTCPIGIEGIQGKHPAEIAVAVSAELLRLREAREEHDGLAPARERLHNAPSTTTA